MIDRRIALSAALALAVALGGGARQAAAGEADVVSARAEREAGGSWRFEVTLRHADESWDHYADAWEVLAPDGRVLATRRLLHPHVEEQPFTRSLSGVALPDGLTRVILRGHDSVHGYGGATLELALPEEGGS